MIKDSDDLAACLFGAAASKGSGATASGSEEGDMKISQTGPGAPANRSRKAAKGDDAGGSEAFRGHIQGEPAASASGPSTTTPLAALSSLLAIQESPDSTSDRKRALLHGDMLLDELKDLQLGLVQGWVSEDSLRSLSHLLNRPRPAIDDADLIRTLDEIEVRAAVELAKLERKPR